MKLKDAIEDILKRTWSDSAVSSYDDYGNVKTTRWCKSHCGIENQTILAHLNKYPVEITASIRTRISQVLSDLIEEGKVEKWARGTHRWRDPCDPHCKDAPYSYTHNLQVWRESLGMYVHSLSVEADIPPFAATKENETLKATPKTKLKKIIQHIYDESAIDAELDTLKSEGKTLVSVINTSKHRTKRRKK